VASGQDVSPQDWPQAAEAAPARSRRTLTVTLGGLAAAASGPAAAQAEAVLTILDPLVRARYPDATARLADLRRWPTPPRPSRRCTTRWPS
jgi:hypothetical protein